MKILGIESSSTIASVAVVEDGQLLGEYTINHTLKHSKTLMPMIQEMLNKLELKPKDIGLIAVSEGPGSFTGLRIGSATAKGLAQGLNIPIVSIPTMQVLASTVLIPGAKVHAIMYARAREVYYQTFMISVKERHFLVEPQTPLVTCEIEEVAEKLKKETHHVYLVGDAVFRFEQDLEGLGEKIISFLPVYTNLMAKNVAILGQSRYDDNDVMTYQEHRPYYHKKSQAEREYESKNHAKN
ncbi:tRNA (adenosine(37)-N6)-threonylcarbamoyltransferase complex dimerization subunit type 1 TsaB [Vallitaleaceae bacterium 9-2]